MHVGHFHWIGCVTFQTALTFLLQLFAARCHQRCFSRRNTGTAMNKESQVECGIKVCGWCMQMMMSTPNADVSLMSSAEAEWHSNPRNLRHDPDADTGLFCQMSSIPKIHIHPRAMVLDALLPCIICRTRYCSPSSVAHDIALHYLSHTILLSIICRIRHCPPSSVTHDIAA